MKKTDFKQPWQVEYLRQLKLAERRAKNLPEGWVFTPPTTMPKNKQAAETRIMKLKNVSASGFKNQKLPDYVKFTRTIQRPRAVGGAYNTFPLTQKQYREFSVAARRQQEAEKKIGKAPSDLKVVFKNKEGFNEFVTNRRTPKQAEQLVNRRDLMMVDNFIKSITTARNNLKMISEDEESDFVIKAYDKILSWVKDNKLLAARRIEQMIKTYDRDFTFEIFGSDQMVISPANMLHFLEYWMDAGVITKTSRETMSDFTGTLLPVLSKTFIKEKTKKGR